MSAATVNRPWQGMAGVYYPDQVPPRWVKLATPTSTPAEAIKLPSAHARIARPMNAERAQKIADAYLRTRSIRRVCTKLGIGVSSVYRALEQAGVQPSKQGGAPRREAAA